MRHHNPVEIAAGLAEVDDLLLPVLKLSADLKAAATHLGDTEARFLVDAYYTMQDHRIRTAGQVRSMAAQHANGEPHAVLDWLLTQSQTLEGQVRLALSAYADSRDLGQWMLSITGIGPVLTAGLLAHIDWTKPTVGHIWRYAGLDPSSSWQKGKPRPWNAALRSLCWKVGESFIKFQNNKNDHYGQVFRARKDLEITQNDAGLYAAQAQQIVVDKSTDAWPWYNGCYPAGTMAVWTAVPTGARAKLLETSKLAAGAGVPMLPPAHIHSRARRYAVKLFLSHCHFVGLWLNTNRLAPDPYAVAHLGHAHITPPPNLDEIVGLAEAWAAARRGETYYECVERELLLLP